MGRTSDYTGIEELLNQDRELSVTDFIAASPGTPMPTVYSRIRSLVKRGVLSRIGQGQYVAVHKPTYKVPITDWMLEVNDYLIDNCVGVDNCISQRGENLGVEVARKNIPTVVDVLRKRYGRVIQKRDFARSPASFDGFIIVGPLISEAPITEDNNCFVPTIEKELVDSLCRRGGTSFSGMIDFQRAFEVFAVNVDRMRRYASRRGVVNELDESLSGLDSSRVDLFTKIQKYFSISCSVNKAWVFGSFARREETPESDIDLLVDYDPLAKVSLLDIIRQKLDLERITGRQVDLVERGFLKPFAAPSAERDKYLIYER